MLLLLLTRLAATSALDAVHFADTSALDVVHFAATSAAVTMSAVHISV
jgi:hypothetical protein